MTVAGTYVPPAAEGKPTGFWTLAHAIREDAWLIIGLCMACAVRLGAGGRR